jgi:hypothetical protein
MKQGKKNQPAKEREEKKQTTLIDLSPHGERAFSRTVRRHLSKPPESKKESSIWTVGGASYVKKNQPTWISWPSAERS